MSYLNGFEDERKLIETLERKNAKVVSALERYFADVVEDLESALDCTWEMSDELDTATEELDEAKHRIAQHEKELRFLAAFLCEQQIDFPMSGHFVDFGSFLPEGDARRTQVEFTDDEVW